MKTLEIKKDDAIKAYNATTKDGKELLSHLFGKDIFNQKITDRVKSYEDACDLVCMPLFDEKSIANSLDTIAYEKLKVITRALNEGWTPNWDDDSQYKWYPWFYMNKPGFRFFVTTYDISVTYTTGGSRLCFKSQELAKYAGEQFLDLYKAYLS